MAVTQEVWVAGVMIVSESRTRHFLYPTSILRAHWKCVSPRSLWPGEQDDMILARAQHPQMSNEFSHIGLNLYIQEEIDPR